MATVSPGLRGTGKRMGIVKVLAYDGLTVCHEHLVISARNEIFFYDNVVQIKKRDQHHCGHAKSYRHNQDWLRKVKWEDITQNNNKLVGLL
jgi:predicted metal-dependent phosphotriesterase family hydrolase